ncbi:MAG: methyltransferase domain-containing protein [Bdellovibrio sp.]|nr:methyltransferase domain-containing protein [Bdellovibrio sp.]
MGVTQNKCIVITYTTLYRTGGEQFLRAAETLRKEKSKEFPDLKIISVATESKAAFLKVFEDIKMQNLLVEEFHFFGHSGVYGVMFGTTDWPEQFSPFEWKQMQWPLANQAKIFFHACRTARWLALFLATHFNRNVYGYWWYTTISTSNKKFIWKPNLKAPGDLYIVSCAGRKSHGLSASVLKYLGQVKLYPMIEYKPADGQIDRSYDFVSELYEDTFQDLSVRKDEWHWLHKNIDFNKTKTLLDIGCGNGAFLRQVAPQLEKVSGVDASAGMLKVAQTKASEAGIENIDFQRIDGPKLPFADNQFDTVISVLSFRYLDWDPMINEILRVLKPGGRILILDMVAAPIRFYEIPQLLISKMKNYFQRIQNPKYYKALSKMVSMPAWQQMLKYNPIRAEHEYKWYLQSRFPNSKQDCINIAWHSRIITFNSGPVHFKSVQKTSFP